MNRKRRKLALRARKGVTLIELIVAVTILMVGLLTVVGISGSVARLLGESRSDNLAATAAQSRFEEFAGTSCTDLKALGAKTATSRGIAESYEVEEGPNNTLILKNTVTWKTRRTTRTGVFESLLPCHRVGGNPE